MKKWISVKVLSLLFFSSFAQKHNWQHLDLKTDSFFGISTEKAYRELLIKKKPAPVIVAIIDSGIDTAQEDLKPVLWTNETDGAHGRNYLGFEKGREDVTNLARSKKSFYDSLSYGPVPELYRADYQAFRKISREYTNHVEGMQMLVVKLKSASVSLREILEKIGKPNPGAQDFASFSSTDADDAYTAKLISRDIPHYKDLADYKKHEIDDIQAMAEYHLNHGLRLQEDNTYEDRSGGNNINDVQNEALGLIPDQNYTAYHGTHVAGIIGAKRNNKVGIDGIADNVQIMMLKVVGNIRELRDENLAQAIRFATDHGAKVINLSFGKPYTWNKKAVDDAVKYAMHQDVLLVHAAGNAGEDLDNQPHFPNPVYLDGKGRMEAWIEVGASGPKDDSTLVPFFSNYGKESVDVFAPGVQIYSTLPFNQYAFFDGTSMAAPMVAGLAALIREYYPSLNAKQVKEVIMKSVVKRDILKDKCATGGIVNAYNALKLASTYK